MVWNRSPKQPSELIKRGRLARIIWFSFRRLDWICLRSFVQMLVHMCIAIGIAVLFYFNPFGLLELDDNNLVTILSAVAAVSGALLAVSLAFATFRSQYYTDWIYRSRERLGNQLEKLGNQMKISAKTYPDISRRLAEQYMLVAFYIPGQPVDMDEVVASDKVFHDWASEQLRKSGKKIDFGNINDYESFEKHVLDAHLVTNESRDILTELSMAEISSRSLETLPPLITTWAVVLVFSLVFAFIGSVNIICDNLNSSIMIIPIYLCFFAVCALVIDLWGLISHVRRHEKGYELGVSAFIKQRDSDKT